MNPTFKPIILVYSLIFFFELSKIWFLKTEEVTKENLKWFPCFDTCFQIPANSPHFFFLITSIWFGFAKLPISTGEILKSFHSTKETSGDFIRKEAERMWLYMEIKLGSFPKLGMAVGEFLSLPKLHFLHL